MATTIMNELVERGWSVRLITLDESGAVPFYHLRDEIEWVCVGDSLSKLEKLKKTRSAIIEDLPDAVVGFQLYSFLLGFFSCLGSAVPVIAAERNSINQYRVMGAAKSTYWKIVFALTLASRISVQDRSYVNLYPRWLRARIRVNPNPVWPVESSNSIEERLILNVGRLCPQKHQRFLIDSFALVAEEFPDWKLLIVGEGECREELEERVVYHGIQDRVFLEGAQQDVSSYYSRSSVFAFPSLFEGFPNALGEAMAYGLPAVGLCFAHGVNSLIEDGETGLLSGNCIREFSEALGKLMADESERRRMGRSGREAVKQFEPKAMFDLWEQLILEPIEA